MPGSGARMRLLQRLPNRDIRLVGPFADDEVPAYAALSHRWESDVTQEVDYEDITHGRGHDKTGFSKLTFCAEQAYEDGLQYFWIDSCCINKALDGEHQSAMQSMFRWYQRAAKCYVYLADVSVNERELDEDEGEWKTAFEHSQWFRRGWTLQELLAPPVVEFYSRERVKLGSKSSPLLQGMINSVTAIPIPALQGYRLTSFSEKDRLSWMERRETTFEEDKVYALLGIFDVEVHIHYGQGWTSAYQTLRQAIDIQTRIIQDLCVTHPGHDKQRIEADKGDLEPGVCDWIFENSDFQRWRSDDDDDCRVFWIKGDPGKGKTMLVCSIINELGKTPELFQLCYFFCQATDTRINNAVAVLRGLLYMLIDQQPSLVRHIAKEHRNAGTGSNIFEDVNNWIVLTTMFSKILQDQLLNHTVFIIDGLDECTSKLDSLLGFIASASAQSHRVKWLFSSRNWPTIEESLAKAQRMISLRLELDAETITNGVRIYSANKVAKLASDKHYTESLKQEVIQHLQDNAGDTFLWVALVCKELEAIFPRHVRRKLNEFPPGLSALYARMMAQIDEAPDDAKTCKAMLAIVALTFRPLTLKELRSVNLSGQYLDVGDLEDIARSSGFLTIRAGAGNDNVVSFVHQSAKDYIVADAASIIFPTGLTEAHAQLARRCLQQLCEPGVLKKNLCNLDKPGARRNDYDKEYIAKYLRPEATYAGGYWVEHLVSSKQTLSDGGEAHAFLQKHFLHWLEALSWLGQLSNVVAQIAKLQSRVQVDGSAEVSAFLKDALRFVWMNRHITDLAPLQLYSSALIFTPLRSIVRSAFQDERSTLFALVPKVVSNWSAEQQRLEGHAGWATGVAFSPDGTVLASASRDGTVRLWDAATGALQQELGVRRHAGGITGIAFAPNGMYLASASRDHNVRLWNVSGSAGVLQHTFKGHTSGVIGVAFAPDSNVLASASSDDTVRLWNVTTGTLQRVLEGHTGGVAAVSFAPNAAVLASASYDGTIRLWNATSGVPLQTLEGHTHGVGTVAFAPGGAILASAAYDGTIRLWDAATGMLRQTLEHAGWVSAIAFAPNGTVLASAASDHTIRLWNVATGALRQTLEGHNGGVIAVAFAPNSAVLASSSSDSTVRLWNAATSVAQQILEGHTKKVDAVKFAPNNSRTLASASSDRMVRLWDTTTGTLRQTCEGHEGDVTAVAFTSNNTILASASLDGTIRLWDLATGALQHILKGHTGGVTMVVFATDNETLASASYDETIRLWDVATGTPTQTLGDDEVQMSGFVTLTFESDDTVLASTSRNGTVQRWEMATGALRHPFERATGASTSSQAGAAPSDDLGHLAPSLVTDNHEIQSISSAAPAKLRLQGEWVQYEEQDVLWLPYDFRGPCSAMSGTTLAIGQASGTVSFLALRDDGSTVDLI